MQNNIYWEILYLQTYFFIYLKYNFIFLYKYQNNLGIIGFLILPIPSPSLRFKGRARDGVLKLSIIKSSNNPSLANTTNIVRISPSSIVGRTIVEIHEPSIISTSRISSRRPIITWSRVKICSIYTRVISRCIYYR